MSHDAPNLVDLLLLREAEQDLVSSKSWARIFVCRSESSVSSASTFTEFGLISRSIDGSQQVNSGINLPSIEESPLSINRAQSFVKHDY